MLPNIFQSFATAYTTAFQAGVTQAVTSGLSAVSGVLSATMVLWVVVQGIMVMTGRLEWRAGMGRVIRASVVTFLLTTSGNFTTYVQQFFMTTMPNWIASSLVGSTGQSAGPQQFDQILSAVWHQMALVVQQSSGLSGIPVRIEAMLAAALAGLALAGTFIVYEIAQAMIGLVVAIGPFIIVGILFEATRGVTERWIGKLIGLTILNLLVSILLQILITGDTNFMHQIQAVSGKNPEEQALVLCDLAIFFGMGMVLILMLPGIAAHIGGGIAGASSAASSILGGSVKRGRFVAGKGISAAKWVGSQVIK